MNEQVPWYERPAFDWLLAAGAVAVHFVVVTNASGGGDLLAWHGAERRLMLYGLTTNAASFLLTVGLASLALYIGGRGRRLAEFRRDLGHGALRTLYSVVTGLLVVLLVSLVATALDAAPAASSEPTGDVGGLPQVRWVYELVVVLLLWRFLRVAVIYRGQLGGDLDDAIDQDRHELNTTTS